MKRSTLLALASVSLLALNTPAFAQSADMISFGVGYYDVLDNEGTVDLRVEYRPAIAVMDENLNPWIGAESTSDGSFWGGGGLLYNWEFSPNLYLVPSFGAGLYAQGGSDKDLGHVIEFRSQLELAYEFETTGQRIGAAFGHLSNASLDDQNPGTEVLNLYYHIPY